MNKFVNSCFLSVLPLCAFTALSAQSGTVSAGGNASSSGGSVSYSYGQIDYILASDNNTIVSGGLQQPVENGALPVSLLYFTGRLTGKYSLLQWATANELNNSHFDILRSANAVNFILLSTVQGKGSSVTRQYYHYTDVEPFMGPTYYQLKQVDVNGNTALSQVVVVNLLPATTTSIMVYPNPVQTQMNIVIQSPGIRTYQLILADMNGKVVGTTKAYCNSGGNIINWNIGNLAAGVYNLKAADANLLPVAVIKR